MLNQLCIVSEHWSTLMAESASYRHAIPVFLIRPGKNSLNELFQLLHATGFACNSSVPFSICIDLANAAVEDMAALAESNWICNLVFHPSFYIHHLVPHLFYITGAEGKDRHHLDLLSKPLLLQGYEQAQWLLLDTTGTIAENTAQLLVANATAPDALSTLYAERFLTEGHYNKHLAVQDKMNTNAHWEKQMDAAEATFLSEQPLPARQLQLLAAISKEYEVLKKKEDIYKKELQNYETYLRLIHEQDEAGKINAFYYNEYEVLPLWFKRLGHIVKVLQGKRSFRSLYDNNAKKYKQ